MVEGYLLRRRRGRPVFLRGIWWARNLTGLWSFVVLRRVYFLLLLGYLQICLFAQGARAPPPKDSAGGLVREADIIFQNALGKGASAESVVGISFEAEANSHNAVVGCSGGAKMTTDQDTARGVAFCVLRVALPLISPDKLFSRASLRAFGIFVSVLRCVSGPKGSREVDFLIG